MPSQKDSAAPEIAPRRRRRPQTSERVDNTENNSQRAALLAAARSLFSAEGYDGVSIRKVTQRAGCATMNFYTYFTNKRALLHAIWADVFAIVLQTCDAAVATKSTDAGRAVAFGVAFTRYWVEHPDSYRLVFLNQDKPSSGSGTYFVDSSGILQRLGNLTTLFASAPRIEPPAAVNALLALSIGLAHSLVTIPEYPAGDDTLIDDAMRAMVGGLLEVHQFD